MIVMGKRLNFPHIKNLHNIQESSGVHLANKLRQAHILFKRKKMNVKLAAQTLSESVASAIEFCQVSDINGFNDCEPTINFIRTFNRLFDVFNSRNLLPFEFKKTNHVL